MKIVIESGYTEKKSRFGMGTYVRELVDHIKNVDVEDLSKNWNNVKNKYDIFHFTTFKPFFVSLPFLKPNGSKFILTIYDLIPLIYPKHYPPGVRGWVRWQINKFLIKKNVDAIITISETSKKDICRFIGIDSSKVFVTYLAAPREYKKINNIKSLKKVKDKYDLPEVFALCDADIYYSKNTPNLVKACKLARIKLVLVGGGKKTLEYAKTINFDHPELKHLKNVDWGNTLFLSGMSTDELAEIYNLASIYIQPSFYEGFGIPVVQAFSCGISVVSSKTQALVEIAEAACLFANPNDPNDFADKIKEVLSNTTLRNQLINTGFELARRYSWERTAKETLEVYKKI